MGVCMDIINLLIACLWLIGAIVAFFLYGVVVARYRFTNWEFALISFFLCVGIEGGGNQFGANAMFPAGFLGGIFVFFVGYATELHHINLKKGPVNHAD